jgi:thiazole/oxazole-forming peptide maturase SagD family component
MKNNEAIISLPLQNANVIIECANKAVLLFKSQILILENVDNISQKLKDNNHELISILKEHSISVTKASYDLLIHNFKNTIFKQFKEDIHNHSNDSLLIYYLLNKKGSARLKKIILSILSQKSPGHIHVIKILRKEKCAFYTSTNFVKNNLNKINQKENSKIGKINIANLFSSTNDLRYDPTKYLAFRDHCVSDSGPIVIVEPMKKLIKTNYQLKSFSATYRVPNLKHSHPEMIFNASGYDKDNNLAFLKSVAEAHERFSLGFISSKTNRIETQKLLKQDRIYDYLGISKSDYIKGAYICKPPIEKYYPVIKGTILNNKKKREWWVPLDMAKFPYNTESDRRFCYTNTSGTAAGISREDASARGILEYSERHYFLKHWLLNIPFKKIKRNTLPSDIKDLVDEIESLTDGSIIFGLMDCKEIPHVVAAYVKNNAGWPAFHFCSASDFNKTNALKKSLDELLNSLIFCPLIRKKIQIDPANIDNAADHYCFYHSPKNFKKEDTKKLFHGNTDWSNILELESNKYSSSAQKKLEVLLNILSHELGEITAIDITSPETMASGLYVIKIISEKGLPLWFGHTDLPLEKKIIKENQSQLRKRNMHIHPLG